MSTLEDKVASLFRRVRRLQQGLYAVIGDSLEEATGLGVLRVFDYVITELRSPFRLFEDTFTLTFELIVRFTGRVLYESITSVPRMMVLVDAYTDALSYIVPILRVMAPFSDSVSMTSDLLLVPFAGVASNTHQIRYIIAYGVSTPFQSASEMIVTIFDTDSISLGETDTHIMKGVGSNAIAVTYFIALIIHEIIQSSGLLEISIPFLESVSIGHDYQPVLFMVGSTQIADVAKAYLHTVITDTFDSIGILGVWVPFVETLSVSSDMSNLYMNVVGTTTVTEVLKLFTIAPPLPETFASVASLILASLLSESLGVSDILLYVDMYLVGSTTVIETLKYYTLYVLSDTFTSDPSLRLMTPFGESMSIGDPLQLLNGYMVGETTGTDVLVYSLSTIISDAFQSVTSLIMGTFIDESVSVGDQFNLLDGIYVASTSVGVVLDHVSTSLPALQESFDGVASLYQGIIPPSDGVSISLALDTALAKLVGGGTVNDILDGEWHADDWVDSSHANWTDHSDTHSNVPHLDVPHQDWNDEWSDEHDDHNDWINGVHQNHSDYVDWEDHNDWTDWTDDHVNHTDSYIDDHTDWNDHSDWEDGWANQSHQNWNDHGNIYADHTDSHLDFHENYSDWGDAHYNTAHVNHTDHDNHTDYNQYNDYVDDQHSDHDNHNDHTNDHTDTYNDHDNHTDYDDNETWPGDPEHVDWNDHDNHTDHTDTYSEHSDHDNHTDHTDHNDHVDGHSDHDNHTDHNNVPHADHNDWGDHGNSHQDSGHMDSHSDWYDGAHQDHNNLHTDHSNYSDHGNAYTDTGHMNTYTDWNNQPHSNHIDHSNYSDHVNHTDYNDHDDHTNEHTDDHTNSHEDHTDSTHTDWYNAAHQDDPAHTDHDDWEDHLDNIAPLGGVDHWGRDVANTTNTTVNWCMTMGGTSPNRSGMRLKAVAIYTNNMPGNIRMAVYQGGSLSTGPAGATRLWDAGLLGEGNQGWIINYCSSTITLSANTVTWIAFKGNDNTRQVRWSTVGGAGDFQTARGRWISGIINVDEGIAFPSTWPTDSGGSFADSWYSVYLIYRW